MSWVKLDDRMPDNAKIAPLSDAAFRAYVTSICYCARELTDGVVSVRKAKEWAGRPRVVQELVPQLWEPAGEGFRVHDYLKYNPTRGAVLAEREAAKQRMSGYRSGNVRANIDGTSGGNSEPPVNPVSPSFSPVIPDPPETTTTTGEVAVGVVTKLYENEIGTVTVMARQKILDLVDNYPVDCIQGAFAIAVAANKRSISYVEGVCKKHKAQGSCIDARPSTAGANGVGVAASAGAAWPAGYEPRPTNLD